MREPDWQSEDGSIRLYRGDCLEVMPELEGPFPLLLTDIPYGVVNRDSGGLRNLDKGTADVVDFDLGALAQQFSDLSSGSVYVFCGSEQISQLRAAFVSAQMTTRLGIWEKTNPSPMNGDRLWLSGVEACVFARKAKATFNEHCQKPVWSCASVPSKIHPTQKPVALFNRLIRASSLPGDTVCDPFMGSGTGAIAAMETGRRFIGIEKSPEYFDKAVERLTNHLAARTESLFPNDELLIAV